MKVYSIKYSALEYWVKNKAKPGDLAYYYANNGEFDEFVYTYHYTKPDDNPRWRLWSNMEKLQEYLSGFELIDKCLKEINKLKIEEPKMNKRCENCKHWKSAGGYNWCAHEDHAGAFVPKFTSCDKHELKEKQCTPFDGMKFYLKDKDTGELSINYICEDCGKEMHGAPDKWQLVLPLNDRYTRVPGYHFFCTDCYKKKDNK